MTPRDVLVLCREKDVKAVDLRFTDLLGKWRHTTIPMNHFTNESFEEGFGFDGSSVRGWQSIHESDMLIVPQSQTAFLDPFASIPTLSIVCSIQDPITRSEYPFDPRNIAQRAMAYLAGSGVADQAYFGPECEFFLFDEARFDQRTASGFYFLNSQEAMWNPNDAAGAKGYAMQAKQAYLATPPNDQLMDIRNEIMLTLMEAGIEVECHHHETASGGQAEIDFKYDELVTSADNVMIYKYIVKNIAKKHGKTASFMPKPIVDENGSGMHTHLSLWRNGESLMAGRGYAGLSDLGMHAIGGILKHAPAILALTNPSTNSYKRLVPGFEAPVHLAYSQRNRSASIRIPMYSSHPAAKRIEFRCPDGTSNPYLAFSAILMAAIDGIQNKVHPGEPLDKDIYDLPPEQLKNFRALPGSLEESLQALRNDMDFLLRGDVFSEEVLLRWVEYKWEDEVQPLKKYPHPIEFCQSFDC